MTASTPYARSLGLPCKCECDTFVVNRRPHVRKCQRIGGEASGKQLAWTIGNREKHLMKHDFRIDLTALAADGETRRMTEALTATASGNIMGRDEDRFVAVGNGDDGKVENGRQAGSLATAAVRSDRYVARGDDKIDDCLQGGSSGSADLRSNRYAAAGPGDDKIDDCLQEGTSGSADLRSDRYVAVGVGDDKIDGSLQEGPSGSARIRSDRYVAVGNGDDKIFD